LGSAAGVLVTLFWLIRYRAPVWFGWVPPQPFGGDIGALEGGAAALAAFVSPSFLFLSMLGVLTLVVLVIVFRRRWLALAVFVALVIAIGALAGFEGLGGSQGGGFVMLGCLAAVAILLVMLFLRSGLLALTVAFFFFSKLRRFPVTLDSSAWYAGTSTLLLLALIGIAVYALGSAVRGYGKAARAGLDSSVLEVPPE
jgi:hypothetical protein